LINVNQIYKKARVIFQNSFASYFLRFPNCLPRFSVEAITRLTQQCWYGLVWTAGPVELGGQEGQNAHPIFYLKKEIIYFSISLKFFSCPSGFS
jgi:hypothetical protein